MISGDQITKRAEYLENITSISAEFSWNELLVLAQYMGVKEHKNNDVIFKEGDKDIFMCIIVKGAVLKIKEDETMQCKVITTINKGKVFGEMSLIDGSPRSATAISSGAAILLVLKKEDFERLLKDKPQIGIKLFKKIALSMSYRLRETTGTLVEYLERKS